MFLACPLWLQKYILCSWRMLYVWNYLNVNKLLEWRSVIISSNCYRYDFLIPTKRRVTGFWSIFFGAMDSRDPRIMELECTVFSFQDLRPVWWIFFFLLFNIYCIKPRGCFPGWFSLELVNQLIPYFCTVFLKVLFKAK